MPVLLPGFLLALFAVGIPVIIHLSQRRKFKDFHVGTLRFLRLSERKRNLRLRVEDWLLLLLRILALALLAFLFARPYWSDLQKNDVASRKTLVLLDASGSMTPAMAEEAMAAAKKAVKGDESVTFAEFSDAVQILAKPEDYQPRAGAPSNFTNALGWSLDHLRAQGLEDARIVLAGHFAAAGMPPSPPRVWPPRVKVDVIAVQPAHTLNDAVKAAELLTPFATGEMQIEARITGSERSREVTLSAEGLNLKQTVPPGLERILFSFRPPREEVRGFISLEGKDDWPADDRRPFAMRWAEPEQVLILDGSPGSTPFEGQGYFLQKALTASGAAHGMSPFRPEVVFGLEGRQGMTELEKFSAIALCGPVAVTPAEAAAIREQVERGCGLLIAIDARWTPAATEALLGEGLFPAQKVELAGGMQLRRIGAWDRTHPALASFDGKEGGDLRSLIWRDGFRIPADPAWKAIATLDGGHPLLLEKTGGKEGSGRVFLLAHPLTREWGDLPREPLFVPLAKHLFNTLTGYEARQHSANVRTPGIRETREIGYYQAADGSAEVVAADPGESAVMALDAAGFRKAYALPDTASAPPANQPAATPGDERPRDGEWWPWLAVALLLLLVIECAVATRRSARMQPDIPQDA